MASLSGFSLCVQIDQPVMLLFSEALRIGSIEERACVFFADFGVSDVKNADALSGIIHLSSATLEYFWNRQVTCTSFYLPVGWNTLCGELQRGNSTTCHHHLSLHLCCINTFMSTLQPFMEILFLVLSSQHIYYASRIWSNVSFVCDDQGMIIFNQE